MSRIFTRQDKKPKKPHPLNPGTLGMTDLLFKDVPEDDTPAPGAHVLTIDKTLGTYGATSLMPITQMPISGPIGAAILQRAPIVHTHSISDVVGLSGLKTAGRLTLTSNAPVFAADQTGSTIYFTPYQGTTIPLYDGTSWRLYTFSEIAHSLAGTAASTNYDLFAVLSGQSVTMERIAWTNTTTRATLLTSVDGILVQAGAPEKRYLGTFRTTTAGNTADTLTQRFCWNYHNRIAKKLFSKDTGTSYSFTSTPQLLRYCRGDESLTPKFQLVHGGYAPESMRFRAEIYMAVFPNAFGGTGINLTSTVPSPVSSQEFFNRINFGAATGFGGVYAELNYVCTGGFLQLTMLELTENGQITVYSNSSGLSGVVYG
jgi:hypothetical protein